MIQDVQQDKPKYRVPALEKGLDVLEFLSSATVPQSQTELARALGRSNSELFRMLTCLEERGYILRDELSGKYSLSLRLYELAHTHSPVDQILQVSRQPMVTFAQTMRESVHLAILRDHDLLILAQEESPEPVRISISVGLKQKALKTASGLLLVAHLSESKKTAYLQTDNDYQNLSREEQERAQTKLKDARRDGYIITESSIKVGVRDIAVLIGNPTRELTASLTSPVLISVGQDADTEALLSRLREMAYAITKKLGLLT